MLQLKQIGISIIYLLLSKNEINAFEATKIAIDDYCEPKNPIDYLRSYAHGMMIQVIDSRQAQSDKEKLHFYLATSQDNNLLNLFFCKELISGMSQCKENSSHVTLKFIKEVFFSPWLADIWFYEQYKQIPRLRFLKE